MLPDTNLAVINVLDNKSYTDCRIQNSINIHLDQLEQEVKEWNRKKPLVVYCANYLCPMSRLAWQKLNRMGFKNVWAYEGGIVEWFQMGFPVQGECKLEYLSKPTSKPAVPEQGTEEIRTIGAAELRKLMKI